MAALISNEFRIQNLKAFQASITDTANNSFYLCLARFLPWSNEAAPPTPGDGVADIRALYDYGLAGKQVLVTNTRIGIFLRPWVSGQFYDMYRDDIDGSVATLNPDGSARVNNPLSLYDTYFYVINPTNLNVYKCLYNRNHTTGLQVASTDSSFLTDTSSNVVHGSDGYDWKYMYTVSSGDAALFNTPSFVPCNLTGGAALVNGGIYAILVNTPGAYTVAPTVTIYGDGSGATATAVVNGGGVTWIQVTAPGSGYTHANVVFSGGTGAGGTVARPIIGPTGGHGSSDLPQELGGTYLIVQQKFVADESGSGSKFTVANDFRQMFFLKNPTKSSALVTSTTVALNRSLVLTTNPGAFILDAQITGGTSGAKGWIVDYIPGTKTLRYALDTTQAGPALGIPFQVGETVSDGTNTGTIAAAGVVAPDVDPYTGNVIYFENRLAITRNIAQTEDCRLIVEF